MTYVVEITTFMGEVVRLDNPPFTSLESAKLFCLMSVGAKSFRILPIDEDQCEQHDYLDGRCRACWYECPHDDREEGFCRECNDFDHSITEPDDMHEAHIRMEDETDREAS